MRQVSAIIVVVFFLGYSLSAGFLPGDIDRSGNIDLKDAIIAVQGLQNLCESIEHSEVSTQRGLNEYVGSAIKTFQALAGHETQIQKEDHKTVVPGHVVLAIAATHTPHHIPIVHVLKSHNDLSFQSIDLEQTTPPPELSC